MRKLSDKEVIIRAETLKMRHRSQWSELVFEACTGRSMKQLAALLDRSPDWVRESLRRYAIEVAAGGGMGPRPLQPPNEPNQDIDKQIKMLIRDYAPSKTNRDYQEEYEQEGYTPEVAGCLAVAYEAGENAIEAGVIKADKTTASIRLSPMSDWESRLRRIVSDVRCAARCLNDANIRDLRRRNTCDGIASAHAAWMEQIERIENFHPDFDAKVGAIEKLSS
jgi:hypothetical protein